MEKLPAIELSGQCLVMNGEELAKATTLHMTGAG